MRFNTEIRGDLLIVTESASNFYAVYEKPRGQPQLILKAHARTSNQVLLARAWTAANDKARELGWIV